MLDWLFISKHYHGERNAFPVQIWWGWVPFSAFPAHARNHDLGPILPPINTFRPNLEVDKLNEAELQGQDGQNK